MGFELLSHRVRVKVGSEDVDCPADVVNWGEQRLRTKRRTFVQARGLRKNKWWKGNERKLEQQHNNA